MATGAHRRLDAFNVAHSTRKLPYYDVLAVSEDATEAEIIRAFRKLSLRFHPDKQGGSTEKFQELNQAYKCLKDSESRRKYDDCGFDEDNIDTTETDQFVDAFFGEGARRVDGRSGDWRMGAIEAYISINLEEVPLHMKDIVRIGLNYMVSLDCDFENLVLLQHARVDILYLMVGLLVEGELTQEAFESEDSYTITYYDNPLQPGIQPTWGDQNGKKFKKKDMPRRELNFEEFKRRQKHALAMLENGPPDPMMALEEKYRAKMLATEHSQRAIAAEKRREAIRGQDVYEDDAELDVNEYSQYLAQHKGTSVPDTVPPVVHDGDTELACESLENVPGKPAQVSTVFESAGTDQVLGENSDGILFVAAGGKVLRNEGPARPRETAEPIKRTDDEKPELTVSFLSDFHGCICLESSFRALRDIFRLSFTSK